MNPLEPGAIAHPVSLIPRKRPLSGGPAQSKTPRVWLSTLMPLSAKIKMQSFFLLERASATHLKQSSTMALNPETIAIVILAGLFCGFLNAVASSGSAVSLPVLMSVGLHAVAANATNRVPVLVGAMAATVGLARRGAIPWKRTLQTAGPITLGAAAGALLSERIPGHDLRIVIVAAVTVALVLILTNLKKLLNSAANGNAKVDWKVMLLLFGAGVWTGFIVLDAGTYMLLVLVLVEQNYGISLTYRFSTNLLAFIYSHVDVSNPTANSYFTSNSGPDGGTWNAWKFDNFEINDQYFFRSNFWLGWGYTFTNARLASTVGGFNPKWHQISAMIDYDVTRQTSLYMQAEAQHVVSAHTGTEFDDADNPAAAEMSSGENQLVCRIGITHRF